MSDRHNGILMIFRRLVAETISCRQRRYLILLLLYRLWKNLIQGTQKLKFKTNAYRRNSIKLNFWDIQGVFRARGFGLFFVHLIVVLYVVSKVKIKSCFQYYISMPSENIKKLYGFLMFSGGIAT